MDKLPGSGLPMTFPGAISGGRGNDRIDIRRELPHPEGLGETPLNLNDTVGTGDNGIGQVGTGDNQLLRSFGNQIKQASAEKPDEAALLQQYQDQSNAFKMEEIENRGKQLPHPEMSGVGKGKIEVDTPDVTGNSDQHFKMRNIPVEKEPQSGILHRKTLTDDGNLAPEYAGLINVPSEYLAFGPVSETPLDAKSLTEQFFADWQMKQKPADKPGEGDTPLNRALADMKGSETGLPGSSNMDPLPGFFTIETAPVLDDAKHEKGHIKFFQFEGRHGVDLNASSTDNGHGTPIGGTPERPKVEHKKIAVFDDDLSTLAMMGTPNFSNPDMIYMNHDNFFGDGKPERQATTGQKTVEEMFRDAFRNMDLKTGDDKPEKSGPAR